MIREIKDTIKDYIWKAIKNFSNFEPDKNIIIFSDPRGGSTWITEMIMTLPRTAVLWEPLHLGAVEHFRSLGFGWRQYIPEDKSWEEAQEAFEKVFRGKVLTHWTCRMITPGKLLSSERMIIKFVRANAMIPWLTKVFDFQYPPVFLLRHPLAVVASQLDYGAWDYEYTHFQIPDCPFNHIYVEHEKFLSSLSSKAEALVAIWCITNRIALTNERNNKDWITIFYEDLIQEPQKEMDRLFKAWKMEMPDEVMDVVRRPSITAKDNAFTTNTKTQLSKWMKYFSNEEMMKLQRVLDYFEIEVYNTKSPFVLK